MNTWKNHVLKYEYNPCIEEKIDFHNPWIKILSELSLKEPRGVAANVLDYDIVVRKFELQLRYYDHFRSNTLCKGMKPLISPAMG